MPASWQEHFFEKLVAAANADGDGRLATARLHRRKQTASFQHSQLRALECSFGTSRNSGSRAQVLLIECEPKRGTEVDATTLRREMKAAGIGGEADVDEQSLFFQVQWGYGEETPFPIHDSRRVSELTTWATQTVRLLFDHLEQRQYVVTASKAATAGGKLTIDLHVALERYLEDLLIQEWDQLSWGTDLEYVDRQVACGSIGFIDILAKDRTNGDYVVIELKRDQGDDEVVGQCSRYMGWITEHQANPSGVGVRGIIVVHDISDRLRSAVLPHPNISLYTYSFSVTVNPTVATVQ